MDKDKMYQLSQLTVATNEPHTFVMVNIKDGSVRAGSTKGWVKPTSDDCFAARRALRLTMAAMKEK